MTRIDTTKTVLVLGITGGYGGAMARELLTRGYRVRAMVRDRARGAATVADMPGPVDLYEGGVLDAPALASAAAGVDFIVHGVNPSYDRWEPFVVEACKAVARVAVAERACVVFPGNVYNFTPGVDIDETTPQRPPTRKGEIRIEAERVLQDAVAEGARLLLLRGGDFFGVGHEAAWSTTLLGQAVGGGRMIYAGPLETRHQWAFLPDFAAAHVALMDRAAALPAAASFHFEGHVATGSEWLAACRDALGTPDRKWWSLPWFALKVAGLFSGVMRELVKMRYLWDEEVVMRGAKLREVLPEVPHTPLADALRVELAALGMESAAKATPRPARRSLSAAS